MKTSKLPFAKIFQRINVGWEYIYYRFFSSRPKIDVDHVSRRYLLCGDTTEGIADIYRNMFPGRVDEKIREADLICEHIFNLLGSGNKRLSREGKGYQPIDWHSDFKSGYRWDPKTFYHNIPYGHIEGVDIKVPWELSRFQHLNTLGQAFILTGDRKYSEEFAGQITDWIRNNPVGFGVNWRCTMDTAVRAVNWLVSMEYFLDENLFVKDFLDEFYISIYEHGKFIRSHLENVSGWTTNHYLSNIASLFFIAIYCPFFKESREWSEFAHQELHREIEKQVYPDGCSFESSTSYHRLVLETLFYSMLLGDRAGMSFSDNYKEKVKKMFEVSLYIIKPNGTVPQIGDNDSGRFLKFSQCPGLKHEYLLSLATVYFRDYSFKIDKFDFEDAFWIFGDTVRNIYGNPSQGKGLVKLKTFRDAGWYIIRDGEDYCFISCGHNGGEGWHAHNDKLSFELMIDGHDIIVDPGTYVYTSYPEERNRFRSTEYHNTVKFNGFEQNEIPDNGIFSLPERVEIKSVELVEDNERVSFTGEIRYLDITHKRTVTFNKKDHKWQISDVLYCQKSINAKLLYHLSPDVTFKNNAIYSRKTGGKLASIEVAGHNIRKDRYDYSPEYGVKVDAECLIIDTYVQDKQIVVTYIFRDAS